MYLNWILFENFVCKLAFLQKNYKILDLLYNIEIILLNIGFMLYITVLNINTQPTVKLLSLHFESMYPKHKLLFWYWIKKTFTPSYGTNYLHYEQF